MPPASPPEGPVVVTDATFECEVLRSPLPVVVDFYAVWAVPCRAVLPTVTQLAARLTGRVKFANARIDEAERVSRLYGIHALPTFVFVAAGQERGREVGPIDPVTLRANLIRYFAPSPASSGGRPAIR